MQYILTFMRNDSLAHIRHIFYNFLLEKGIKITPEEHNQMKAWFGQYGEIYHQQMVRKHKLIKPIRNESTKPQADSNGWRVFPYEQ